VHGFVKICDIELLRGLTAEFSNKLQKFVETYEQVGVSLEIILGLKSQLKDTVSDDMKQTITEIASWLRTVRSVYPRHLEMLKGLQDLNVIEENISGLLQMVISSCCIHVHCRQV
jgi:hypothetical protein